MKKLFITIALLIIVSLTTPKFIGSVVETEHQLAVAKIDKNPAITINSSTFTRNWFGGNAATEMTILLQDNDIDDITIIIEENLSFGPIMFTEHGLQLALSYSQANINFKGLIIDEEVESFINDKIHLTGLLTFSKDIVASIVIDEVSKEIDDNKILSAKALGNFTLENDNRLFGNFHWAGLTATTNDESFIVDEVNFSLDQTLIAGDFYQGSALSTGDFDFSISAIQAKDVMDKDVFTLDNLLVSAISSVQSNLMKVAMNYSAEKLTSAGQQLEKANLDIVFHRLNIEVMQDANTLMTELSAEGQEMFSPDNMKKLSALAAKLLADDPLVEIKNLSVETPEGKIESALQVSVDNKLFDASNLMSIMAAVKANAKGSAPMPFFTKLGLASMVDMYVQQGFILQKDDELSFKVNFAQGQLNVNGNVIPL